MTVSASFHKNRNLLGLLLTITGLSGCIPKPEISVSEPKFWVDEQVLQVLASKRNEFKALTDSIKDSELKAIQQSWSVKDASRTDLTGSGSPATDKLVSAPASLNDKASDKDDIKYPDKSQFLTDDVSLTYSDILRSRVDRDWETTGRQLLYSGDSDLLDRNKYRLVLLRFDISLNNYIRTSGFNPFNDKRFAYVDFEITANTTKNVQETDSESNTEIKKQNSCKPIVSTNDIRVYYLSPEYHSAISKDAIITSKLEDYSAQFGGIFQGFDIQAAGRQQKLLEESLIKLSEIPLTFTVYGKDLKDKHKTQFTAALGPNRQIEKRSWINPARIFGNTYRIDYNIEPGTRQIYALLILNKSGDTDCLNIKNTMHSSFKYFDGIEDLPSTDLFPETDLNDNTICLPSNAQPNVELNSQPESSGNTIQTIYAGIPNSVVIDTKDDVSTETQVFLGSTAIPKSQITIIGNKKLRLDIPASKELGQLVDTLNNNQGNSIIKLKIVTPNSKEENQDIKLEKIKEGVAQQPPKKEIELSRNQGRYGEDIKLTIIDKNNDTNIDLAHFELFLGGQKVESITPIKEKDGSIKSLYFTIPKIETDTSTQMSIKIKNRDSVKILTNIFTYLI